MSGADLGNPEFQEKLECSTRKVKLYVELADNLARAEMAKDQIIIKIFFKNCCALGNTL